MMKRMKQVGVLLVLLLVLLVPTAAFAADAVPAIGVQLNGEDVAFTDAAPVNENGRVYVPFRAVFEALDADVDYNAENGLIMAEKDGVKVTFKVDQNVVTVNKGVPTDITIDAAPFIRDGRTYVPVRFAAQTLGLEVGWDGNAQTVVMLDKAALKEAAKGQYTLMDKYMKYLDEQKLIGPTKTEGDFQFEMQVSDGETMIPITGTMKMNGISTTEAVSMGMTMELNFDELQAVLQEAAGEPLTGEEQLMFKALEDWDMQIIVDAKSGKAYMKSNIFALADMDGTAWYMVDLNKAAAESGMNLQQMLESEAAGLESYEESVMQLIDNLTAENAIVCDMTLAILDMYRDDSFQKMGNNYMSSMRYSLGSSDMGDMAMSMSVTVKTNGSAVTGCTEALTMFVGNQPMMTMKNDLSGRKSTMDMNMNVMGMMTMRLSGSYTYTAATEKPQAAPPAGSVIIDMTLDAAV